MFWFSINFLHNMHENNCIPAWLDTITVDCLVSNVKQHLIYVWLLWFLFLFCVHSVETQKQIIILREKSLEPNSKYLLKVEQKEIWSRCRRYIWSTACKTKNGTASQVSVALETVSLPAAGMCLLEPQSGIISI